MNNSQQILPRPEIWSASLVALSAILYGFLGCLGIKLLQQHFSLPSMLFWRFFIAAIWMIIGAAISRKEKLFAISNRQTLLLTVVLGSICYGGGSAFYFLASEQMGTGLAMVVFFTYPLFVVALAWMVEKRAVSKVTAGALLAIIVGMVLIKGHGDSVFNKAGVIYSLLAAFCYGFYIYGSKYVIKVVSSSKLTILVCLSCAAVFLAMAICDHSFTYPTSVKNCVYLAAIGIISTALPIQLLLEGLKTIHPNKVSVLSVLEPVVTLFIGVMVLGETTSLLQATGAGIILLSAIWLQFERG